jgi:SAM-dependent methyltransferase
MRHDEYRRMFQAEAGHWWYAGMRRIMSSMLESLPHRAGNPARTLDAGCGTGFNLSELGLSAVGVDASDEALVFCRMRGIENAVRADIAALPFSDGAFDRVFSLDVLSDRGVADDRRALAELSRVLAPGGVLVVRVPALGILSRAHDEAVETHRRYRLSELTGMLEAARLSVLRVSYCNTILMPAIAARALFDRIRRRSVSRPPARSELDPLPDWLESTFRSCLEIEARWLRRRNLPLGASLVAIAIKPE